MTIHVSTSSYQFSHGRKPRGQGYWAFKLCTASVTAKDKIVWVNASYAAALKQARELAAVRRAHTIVVMP